MNVDLISSALLLVAVFVVCLPTYLLCMWGDKKATVVRVIIIAACWSVETLLVLIGLAVLYIKVFGYVGS